MHCFAFVCYSQMNTSGIQVYFLSCSRNISVQLVWEGLDVTGDIVAIQWILGATGMQIQYNYVTLYKKLCSVMFDAYRPVARIGVI